MEATGLCPTRLARIDGWMDRLVADGKLAGLSVTVARRGSIAYRSCRGLADRERQSPMADDTIVRIYSMTKPITSVAVMMLYEEGRFQLDDPISRFLPAFAHQRVAAGDAADPLQTVPASRDISFRDLLTHTSGLTYGFMEATAVDALYRANGIDFQTSDATLGRSRRARGSTAAIGAAGCRMELQHRHRRAGPPRRGHLGAPVRDLPAGADPRTARHDRYRLSCPAGEAVPLCRQLQALGRRHARPDRRSLEWPVRVPARDLLWWRRGCVPLRATTCASAE